MRYPIFTLTTVAVIAALAPEQAHAGDPEADKRVYDAFTKYMQTVPAEKKAQEYKKFLEWYPNNIYAPTVQKEYEAFLAGGQPTPTPVVTPVSNQPPQNTANTSTGGFGISTKEPSERTPLELDPIAEAAEAIGGVEGDAAAALDGAVVSSDPSIPVAANPTLDIPVSTQLRRPKSYGLGVDMAFSALIGPGVVVDYTMPSGLWTVGGALRVPLFQSVQGALDVRRFLTPQKPLSVYLGGTVGGVAGNIDAILSLVQIGFPGSAASSATTFGALAGVQKMRTDGRSYYFELSYQGLFTEFGEQAFFPGAAIGYRYFKDPNKPKTPKARPYSYSTKW